MNELEIDSINDKPQKKPGKYRLVSIEILFLKVVLY